MAKYIALNKNSDFRALYHRGKSQVHSALVTYVKKNRFGVTRVGITVGKKLGSAVERNRCRRIIREAYRQTLPRVPDGWDIVFVARRHTLKVKSTYILKIMQTHFKVLGVLDR